MGIGAAGTAPGADAVVEGGTVVAARPSAERVRTRDPRPVPADADRVGALRRKVGRRRDLTTDRTRRPTRLRGFPCGIAPDLERAMDVACTGPPVRLARFVAPDGTPRAGRTRLGRSPPLHGPEAPVDRALGAARARIARIGRDPEAPPGDPPDGALIRAPPGMGAVRAADVIAGTGDIRRVASPDAPAAVAVQRRSGTRNGWRALGGDRALPRAPHQTAVCAVVPKDPLPQAVHDRKHCEGRHHTLAAALRLTSLRTMLRRRRTSGPDRRAA